MLTFLQQNPVRQCYELAGSQQRSHVILPPFVNMNLMGANVLARCH